MSSIKTSTVTSGISMLHVAFGLLVQEKRLLEHLYQYRVTTSYDDARRFKISVSSSIDTRKTLEAKQWINTGSLI